MSEDNTFYGNYLGIVIQNNDPDRAGKVKIWIPHISPTVYEGWSESSQNKSFSFIGKNINSDLTDIIEDLKKILPWAQCAAPITGSSTSGKYNANLQQGTISDSNRIESSFNGELSDFSLNSDGIGEKPARKFEPNELKLHDDFVDSQQFPITQANKFGYNYTPNSYSNAAKGSFSIPNVGAHVWVFFENGDPTSPVYFAAAYGDSDWNSIYDSSELDYPGSYENKSSVSDPVYNPDTETYRNKYVVNQKGGTFEIVNTDNKELLKLTHYSGSFLEFSPEHTSFLATGNAQNLVLKHKFETVRGNNNSSVNGDSFNQILGDSRTIVGNHQYELYKEYRGLLENIAAAKALFDINRSSSPGQQQNGTYAPCPLCTDPSRSPIFQNRYKLSSISAPSIISDANSNNTSTSPSTSIFDFSNVTSLFSNVSADTYKPTGGATNFLSGGNCPVCNGTGLSPSTYNGDWSPSDKDALIGDRLTIISKELLAIEKKLGTGGSKINHIAKHKFENIGLIMNTFPSHRIDEKGKINHDRVLVLPNGVVTSYKESALIEQVHVDDLPGGTCVQNIANRWNIYVGSGGIDIKTTGYVDIGGAVVNIGAKQVNIGSELETNIHSKILDIEAEIIRLRNSLNKQVLVEGNLGVTQNVAIAGSMHVEGEVSLHHITAPVEVQETHQQRVYGETITNKILGYATAGTVKITPVTFDAGSNGTVINVDDLTDTADYEFNVVLSDNTAISTKVKANADAVELTEFGMTGDVNSDVGDFVIDDSGPTLGFRPSTALAGTVYGVKLATSSNDLVVPVRGLAEGDSVTGYYGNTVTGEADSLRAYPHAHQFNNLPLKLMKTKDGVRQIGSKTDEDSRQNHIPVIHEKKLPETLE